MLALYHSDPFWLSLPYNSALDQRIIHSVDTKRQGPLILGLLGVIFLILIVLRAFCFACTSHM